MREKQYATKVKKKKRALVTSLDYKELKFNKIQNLQFSLGQISFIFLNLEVCNGPKTKVNKIKKISFLMDFDSRTLICVFGPSKKNRG